MLTSALTLLSHVVLWVGLLWCVVLAWHTLRWCVGRFTRAEVLVVSKRGLYDPHAREEE